MLSVFIAHIERLLPVYAARSIRTIRKSIRSIASSIRSVALTTLCGASLAYSSLALTSCNNIPVPVGGEFFRDTLSLVTVRSDTAALITSTEFGQIGRPMNRVGWFVGRSETIEARTFVYFNVPFVPLTNIYPDLTAADIRATLVLPGTSFLYGDEANNIFNFRVLEVLRPWTDLATNDSLAALERSGGSIYGTRLLSYVRTKPAVPPLVQSPIQVPFDPVTILRWLRSDSSNPAQRIYGVAFVPEPQSRSVREIASASEFAYIDVTIRRPSDSVNVFYRFVEEYHASFVRDVAPPVSDGSALVLQPGQVLRSRLNLNLSMLPVRAFIQRAELRITVDAANSRFSNRGMPDTLFLHLPDTTTVTTTGGAASKYSISSTATLRAAGLRVSGTSDYVFNRSVPRTVNYSFASLAALIEQLNEPAFKSKTLLLTMSQDGDDDRFESLPDRRERSDVGKVVIFGTRAANPSVRPVLSISYSIRK